MLPSPDWAKGARVSLTVNNLNDSFGESERLSSAGGREMVVSTQSPQFGRVFNLTLHMSL